MTHTKNNEEIISTLVKLADSLDHEGKLDLATEVDQTLEAFAARPKAPLKSLDEEVKKSLIAFLYKAERNLDESVGGLDEFFRRLRYFDVAHIISDMGLDKVVRDMHAVHEDMETAVKKFYEVTHGRKPGKKDIETLMADDASVSQKPQEFFDSQKKSDDIVDEPEEIAETEQEASDTDLDDFWKDYSDTNK